MTSYILLFSGVLLLCLVLNKALSKVGVPTLIGFICLGMLFGSDGIFKIPFDNYSLAQNVCSAALIIIMFYGGFGTNWKAAKTQALPAAVLSSAGTVITAVLTGLFCHFALKMSFVEGMLMGAVISSTDAASVFVILRSRKLNLKGNTASLLEIESGSNDPFAFMMTMILLSMRTSAVSFPQILLSLFRQIAVGGIVGIVTALIFGKLLRKLRLDEGIGSVLVLSVALLSYSISEMAGGNGYLSTYLTGIMLGNLQFSCKKELVHFFDGLTGMTQMVIFFLLGLLAFPSRLSGVFIPAIAITCFLMFFARPATVFALMAPFRKTVPQKILISCAGLKGASSIVFAIIASVAESASTSGDLFHTVFLIVLFSIALQGTLLPLIAKKLDMIDNGSDVMKTFSDYSEKSSIQFIQINVTSNHPWANRQVKNLELIPEMRLSLILRGGKQIIPRGATKIAPGDVIIACAPELSDDAIGKMSEQTISDCHDWCGKSLQEIRMENHKIVIMIIRGEKTLIPNGETVLAKGDILIINEGQ